MDVAQSRRNFWTGEGLDIDDLLAAAAGEGGVYADTQLSVTRSKSPPGLRFGGEIDVTNAAAVVEMLTMALSTDETLHDETLHLDVSGLVFCDIAGIRAFVDAAERLNQGTLLLHGLPPLLRTVMSVTGWSEIPTMKLCTCGAEPR